jgi:hypothetical protein
MNPAVGGNFVGSPGSNTVFPGEIQVDYIRVYDQTAPLQITLAQTNSNLVLSWPAGIVCHLQAQTNLTGGITTNWIDLTNASTPYTVPLMKSNHSDFYRLVSP